MSTTTYTGIDYAAGQPVNRNTETGIRYGIISSHSVNPDALEDIYQDGTDEDFEAYREQAKHAFTSAMEDFLTKHGLERAWSRVEEEIGDAYQGTGDCIRYSYESDGYRLLIDSSGDLWVLESPYFTYAQFCSPCAPGACYLSSPLDVEQLTDDIRPDGTVDPANHLHANRCYCLGPDWFNAENPMPYEPHKLN